MGSCSAARQPGRMQMDKCTGLDEWIGLGKRTLQIICEAVKTKALRSAGRSTSRFQQQQRARYRIDKGCGDGYRHRTRAPF